MSDDQREPKRAAPSQADLERLRDAVSVALRAVDGVLEQCPIEVRAGVLARLVGTFFARHTPKQRAVVISGFHSAVAQQVLLEDLAAEAAAHGRVGHG